MTIAPDQVREIFKGLENGDGAAFFAHVAETSIGPGWVLIHTRVITFARQTLSRPWSPNCLKRIRWIRRTQTLEVQKP